MLALASSTCCVRILVESTVECWGEDLHEYSFFTVRWPGRQRPALTCIVSIELVKCNGYNQILLPKISGGPFGHMGSNSSPSHLSISQCPKWAKSFSLLLNFKLLCLKISLPELYYTVRFVECPLNSNLIQMQKRKISPQEIYLRSSKVTPSPRCSADKPIVFVSYVDTSWDWQETWIKTWCCNRQGYSFKSFSKVKVTGPRRGIE